MKDSSRCNFGCVSCFFERFAATKISNRRYIARKKEMQLALR